MTSTTRTKRFLRQQEAYLQDPNNDGAPAAPKTLQFSADGYEESITCFCILLLAYSDRSERLETLNSHLKFFPKSNSPHFAFFDLSAECLQYLVDKMITHVLLRPAGGDLDLDDGVPMSPLQDALLAPSNHSSSFAMDDSISNPGSVDAEPTKPRAILDERLLSLLFAEQALAEAGALEVLANQSIRDENEDSEEEQEVTDAPKALRPFLLAKLGDAAASLEPI